MMFVFLWLSCTSSLHILDILSLLGRWLANISSYSVGSLFTFLIIPLDAQKFLILMNFYLSTFSFVAHAFGVMSETNKKIMKVYPHYIVLALTFKLWALFVYYEAGVQWGLLLKIPGNFLTTSRISVWFRLLASTLASTMSTRVTQKTYKVSTSGHGPSAVTQNSSGPGTCISSLAFSKVGGTYWVGLGSNMNLAGDYGGVGSMESITALQVNQSLLSPLKLEVDSNIQACVQPGKRANQEPQQVCFLQGTKPGAAG